MITRWLTINIITVIMIIFWSLYQGYDSNFILIGKLIAQAAFILFLINVNMYFVFLFIRKSKVRNVKVKLAKISKRMMKYHIPIAVTAAMLIIIHAAIMVYVQFDYLWKAKTASGAISIGILLLLLYSGLLRRWKASGKRRRFHYIMAFVFLGFVFIHTFI
ncbi:hypothetical protein [Cytobacillus massiliigabonensis]|uniref:hypothetical protein n=1 Tax=Cytobacillus massiliigabonensis TaxID=1871011 RepID=UPI000C85F430|nr:hypothetical protein [Cytobacillus massiliigabonensis]